MKTPLLRAAILAALLPTLLAGCAGFNPTPLRVDLPAACESVLKPVAAPLPVKAGDDLGLALARRGAALKSANSTIVAGRDCVADQRKAYGAVR